MRDQASRIFHFQNDTKPRDKKIKDLVSWKEIWKTYSHQNWVEDPEISASLWLI